MKPFNPRRLRHRVQVEKPIHGQNPDTGAEKLSWERVFSDVPAEIAPVSVRDFIESQAYQSTVIARITIRARPGLTPDMRIIHGEKIYAIQGGWLPDPDSLLEYVTAPCAQGVDRS